MIDLIIFALLVIIGTIYLVRFKFKDERDIDGYYHNSRFYVLFIVIVGMAIIGIISLLTQGFPD